MEAVVPLLTPANIATYVVAINFAAFAAFGIDKMLAEARAWRISEANLLGLALVGGSPGAYAGRHLFRHRDSQAAIFPRAARDRRVAGGRAGRARGLASARLAPRTFPHTGRAPPLRMAFHPALRVGRRALEAERIGRWLLVRSVLAAGGGS